MAPPIPARLARRPTLGGLVIPHITTIRPDRVPVLSAIDEPRRLSALVRRLCGVCGDPLGSPLVFLVRERDFTESAGVIDGWSVEPALHPECLRYSVQACPMLSGAMTHYRSTPPVINRPGAQRMYADAADAEARRGHPAEPWFEVWTTGYDVPADGPRAGYAHLTGRPRRLRPLCQNPAAPGAVRPAAVRVAELLADLFALFPNTTGDDQP